MFSCSVEPEEQITTSMNLKLTGIVVNFSDVLQKTSSESVNFFLLKRIGFLLQQLKKYTNKKNLYKKSQQQNKKFFDSSKRAFCKRCSQHQERPSPQHKHQG